MSRVKVFYILLISIGALFSRACGVGLSVTPSPQVAVGGEGEVVSLLCTATEKPSICLWRTPYQSIYTVGGGRVWEEGRLSSSPGAGPRQCGLVINGLQARDAGAWQCEVGAVVDGEFTTTTAEAVVRVVERVGKGASGSSSQEGLEGDEAVLNCGAAAGVEACGWSSPSGQEWNTRPGEYAERGRLRTEQGCGLRISSLQRRDEGEWVCRAGTIERATRLTIETPLKLSAPTSILQQADERATLVCHANKEYASCEWETPYGRTVSFSDNHKEEESGRLQYFGFSSMDCGIVIRDIGTRDSGGWTCRVSATVAGQHQISADIVRLFVEPTSLASPRSISPPAPAPAPAPDYGFDYKAADYDRDQSKVTDEYDAFDYVNGDFDKVDEGRPGLPRPGVVEQHDTVPSLPSRMPPPRSQHTQVEIEEDEGFRRITSVSGKFGTVRIDKIPDFPLPPPATSAPFVTPFVAFGGPITESADFAVFPAVQEEVDVKETEEEEEEIQTGLNPRELDFLARISGSRVDDRPFRLPENETGFGQRQSTIEGGNNSFQFGDITLVGDGGERSRGRDQSPAPQRGRGRGETTKSDKEKEEDEYNRKRVMEEQQRRLRDKAIKEEEERRDKIKILREQQIEESRKLQEERDRLRLQEAQEKQKEEQERAEAARQKEIAEERERKIALRRAEEKRMRELREEKERKETLQKLREEREKQLREEREKRIKVQQEKERREKDEARRVELAEQEEARRIQIKKEEEEKIQKELQAEREKKLREERDKQLREEREKILKAEREKSIRAEREKSIRAEREKKIREERERKMREERNKRRKEDRERRLREEREKKKLEDEARAQQERADKEKARIEEEHKAAIEKEARGKAIQDELHRQALENEQREKARIEKEQKKALEKEEREKSAIEKQRSEEELAKKVLEEEREKKRQEELEERRTQERDRIRKDFFNQRKKADEEERRKKNQEDRQRKIDEEKERLRQAEVRRIQADNERIQQREKQQRRRQEEMEKRFKIEKERIRQDELESERKEAIEKKKKAEEEERLNRVEKERERRFREERQKARQEAIEARRKEEEELAVIRAREKERRDEIDKLRQLQVERDQKLEEERDKIRAELLEEKKKEQQELEMIRAREKARREELVKLRELQSERSKLLEEERDRIKKENEQQKAKEESEAEKLRQQADARREEITKLRAQQHEREKQLQAERERIRQQKEQLEKQHKELQRQRELLEEIRRQQEESKQKVKTTTNAPLPTVEPAQLRKCLINPWPDAGNITCTQSVSARGQYIVRSGHSCHLNCNKGFVTLDAKETVCEDGTWSKSLYCVKPGAMLIVGGRGLSGVLPSVELVTSGGVCKNIVPDLPHSRWKMITASVSERHVVACGGVNFLGDPKTDCWRLDFSSSRPRWTDMSPLTVPRDAAAWAAEGGKLYVMGGNLGPLSGYTDNVEVYDPTAEEWTVGPSLTSSRASHCAVGTGSGAIVVTGGYGALRDVQQLELRTGQWSSLPSLKPVRAQHGCAWVEFQGRSGMMVVGGDSGGTRLNDVRFLALDRPGGDWRKVADLKTARWGRPSVGTIGGKITVIGGYDGRKALNSVEFYSESGSEWEESRRTRLAQERRWAAGTQISHKLFTYCVQKRS